MTEQVYKLKQGSKEFDELISAVKVAKAKAAENDEDVVVCRKLLNTFEPVVSVSPDGSEERLTDDLPR